MMSTVKLPVFHFWIFCYCDYPCHIKQCLECDVYKFDGDDN